MRWPSSHPLLFRLRLEQVLVIHAAPGIYRQHEPDISGAARVIQNCDIMLTPRGQIQRVSVLPARASTCQSTSTAAYSYHTFRPTHRAYCITPRTNKEAFTSTRRLHLKRKSCLNSIAASLCHPLKMANINTVDINHLKKGEVNLGVSASAPRITSSLLQCVQLPFL